MTAENEAGATGGARRASPRVVAVVVVLLGMIATVVVVGLVRSTVRTDARTAFERNAEQLDVTVTRQVTTYFDNLRGAGSFVTASGTASNEQFKGYLNGARTFELLPSLQMVFYLQRVEADDLDAFVERARARDPGFAYLPLGPVAPGRPHYLLTYFAGGNTDMVFPLGADAGGIAAVANVVESAGRSGAGVVGSFQDDPYLQEVARSTNFPLIQQLFDLDFFIGLPVYEAGHRPGDGTAPAGWIAGAVADIDSVLAAATKDLGGSLGVSLTVDLADAGVGNRQDLTRVARREGQAGPLADASFVTDWSFEADGVPFRMTTWSGPDADRIPLSLWLLLVGGVLVSVSIGAVVYLRMRARERERAFARELADNAEFRREVVDSVTSAMVVLDRGGAIVASNPAWAVLRGSRPTDAGGEAHADFGSSYLDVLAPHLLAGGDELRARVAEVLGDGAGVVEVDVAADTGTGRRWFEVRATPLRGTRGGAVIVHTDITERKRSHDELELKASHDDLTGLLNRQAFEAQLESDLLRARADSSAVAVLFIDLDGFKPINDRYGHAAGDDVLRTVAQRITSAVRTSDRVARLGGDEFVVLVAPLAEPGVAERTAERLVGALSEPVRFADQTVTIGASVGVAFVEAPLGISAPELMERADRAMYQAKSSGGASFRVAP